MLSRGLPAISLFRLLGALLLVSACGDRGQTAVDLSDFALHQRDNVTTDLISPEDAQVARFLAHGWRIDPGRGDGPAALVMRRDRARLWFYSADGKTSGVELRGGLARAKGERGRRLSYRVNGENESAFTVLPGLGLYVLEMRDVAVRQGWNALDLRMRRVPGVKDGPLLRLRGLRFLNEHDVADVRERQRRIETRNGTLYMPAGSRLTATFEMPRGARLTGRVIADGADDKAGPIEILIKLADESGLEVTLAEARLEPGQASKVEAPLSDWEGQLVQVSTLVTGSPRTVASWREARITGRDAQKIQPFDQLIRPTTPQASARLGRPNVVVILMDAARADAFSPWGGPYETPALEALVAEGTKFGRALSPSSWTGQSIPAIFTGFYPDTVGVRQWGDELTGSVPTLAELFGAEGYHTVLWSQHPLYSRGPTLSRGFERTTYSGRGIRTRLPTAQDLFVEDKPSFAFVHLLPPHSPYSPPAPYVNMYSSWYTGDVPKNFRILGRFPKKRDPATFDADDRKFVRDRYQNNVAFADHLVGQIVRTLEATGRYDDTLIAIVSDHGEAFLEHGRYLHSRYVYSEFIHVPFVIKWPASTQGFRKVVDETVTLIDLAPTLASGLGLAGADKGFQGLDLMPSVFGDARPERAVYAVTRGDGDPKRAPKRWVRLERDGWAVVWNEISDHHEIYDLANDPKEQRDLATERPILAKWLLEDLRAQYFFNHSLLGLTEADGEELDPELAAELKALGYL